MAAITVATVTSFLERTVTHTAENADETHRYAFPPSSED